MFFLLSYYSSIEVLQQWEQMNVEDPTRAAQLRETHISGRAKRDYAGLCKVVTQWTRTKQLESIGRMKEVCQRKFYAKHRAMGYSESQIDKKFQKASSADMVKKGLCRKQGKKIFVYMPKANELAEKDILALSMQGEGEDSWMSKSSCKDLLRGKQGAEMGKNAKASFLGGLEDTKRQSTTRHC